MYGFKDLYKKPDPNTGKVHTICSRDTFSLIRSLISFRLTGGTKDYIVVGSDSGRISILEYNPEKSTIDRVHCETFGKSGCRRIVPGQFLANDPKGRAVMVICIDFKSYKRMHLHFYSQNIKMTHAYGRRRLG